MTETFTANDFRDYQMGDSEAVAHLNERQRKIVDDFIVITNEMQRLPALREMVATDEALLTYVRVTSTVNMASVVNAVNAIGDLSDAEIANVALLDEQRLLATFVIAVGLDRMGIDAYLPSLRVFRAEIDQRFNRPNASAGLERLLSMSSLAGDIDMIQKLSSAATQTMIGMVEHHG